MKKSWTEGLDVDLAKEIRGDFTSSHLVRKRLKELLEDKIRVSHKNSLTKDGYEIANWALKQADQVGYERAINDVIDLIV